MRIERIRKVRLDCFDPTDASKVADIAPWKARDGFECLASIGDDLYHGVSPDGRSFAIDRYPVIRNGIQPQVVVSNGLFCAFYTDRTGEQRTELRLAQGADIHALSLRSISIFGLEPGTAVSRPAVVRLHDRWAMLLETFSNGRRSIARAEASSPEGPWNVTESPFLDLAAENPVAISSDDGTVMFSFRLTTGSCLTMYGRLAHRELRPPLTPLKCNARISSSMEWGGNRYVYFHHDGHFRRAAITESEFS